MDPSPRFPERPESVFLRTMAPAPRTLAVSEPFDTVEGFLEHLYVHLRACALTQALALPINQLLDQVTQLRATRAQLARVVFALQARQIFCDDELNRVLDDTKAVLSADKSDAGVALYKDVFENKSPVDTRKYVLGQQLTTMTFWPGKMAGSLRPEVNDLAVQSKQATDEATTLLNDISTAETALSQFDTGPRAAFIDACNAAVKLVAREGSGREADPRAERPTEPGERRASRAGYRRRGGGPAQGGAGEEQARARRRQVSGGRGIGTSAERPPPGTSAANDHFSRRYRYTRGTMNKIIPWFSAASMALLVAACGGKVVVDGVGDNSGGASNLTTSATTASGTPQSCGDLVIPAPGSLMGCGGGVGVGGGSPGCVSDLCDSAGNSYEAVCTGNICSCRLNGFEKCGCTTAGVTDFCIQAPPCCPWIPIPL